MKKKFILLLAILFACCLNLSIVFCVSAEDAAFIHAATYIAADDSSIAYYNPDGQKYGSFPGVSNLLGREEFTFEGTGIGIWANGSPGHATGTIYIDDVQVGTADFASKTGSNEFFRKLDLEPGQHTVRVEIPKDKWVWFDGFCVYDGYTNQDTAGLNAERIDESQMSITPNSWWEATQDKFENGKAIWNTGSADIEASYVFNGVGVGVFLDGVKASEGTEFAGGLCAVMIDGRTRAIVDTRAFDGLREVVVATDLEAGEHTVRVIKLDTGNVTFDGLKVYSEEGEIVETEMTVVEENDPAFVFSTYLGVTSAWDATDGGIDGGNGKSVFVGGACESAAMELPFVGTGVGIVAQGQPEGATFEIFIDGKSVGTVDLTTKSGFSEVFAKKDLEYGMHIAKIVVTEGGWCVVDAFRTYAPKQEEADDKWEEYVKTVVNDNDSNIVYNAQWVSQTEKTGYVGNDFHFCGNNVESTINYTFTGAGIEILAQTQAAGGTFKVYIDDVEVATVDLTVPPYEISAVVFSSNVLEYGTHSIRMERVLNGADKYIVFDAFNVMKSSTESDVDSDDYVLEEIEIEEGYLRKEKAYNTVNSSVTDFADTTRSYISSAPGASYDYQFRGVGLEIFGCKRVDGGKFRVVIDGLDYGVVNTYAAEKADNQLLFAMNGLKFAVHEVNIVVVEEQSPLSSGRYVELQGLNVIAKQDVDEDNIDPDYDDYVLEGDGSFDSSVYEQQTLSAEELHTMSAGFGIGPEKDYITTSANNSTVNIVFRGTGIEIYADRNTGGAKFEVYIDGVFDAKVNTFDATEQIDVVVYRKFGMDNDEHVVTITKIAEKSIAAPATTYLTMRKVVLLKVIGDVDTSQKINNNHYNIYSEGFGTDLNNGYYNGDALFGNFFGTYVEFKFKGTGVKWFGSRNTDNGVASVYLDGELVDTVDTRGESYILSTQLWKITGLENKNHTLRLVIDAENNLDQYKSYITVDYFVVYDYEEWVFEGYPEVPPEEVVNPSEPPKLPERHPVSADIVDGSWEFPVWAIVLIGIGAFAVVGAGTAVITLAVFKKGAKK